MKDNRLPVLIANIQPLAEVTQDWNWSLLTTNQGIHGSQDTANMLMRLGVKPTIITEAVSYTHLDVYKRQRGPCCGIWFRIYRMYAR